jgi:hypothetical protein
MRFQVDIGEELANELGPVADEEERTITQLVRWIVRRWLADRAKGGGNDAA